MAAIVAVVSLILSASPAVAASSHPFLFEWGSPGTGDGQFNAPEGVGIDSSGNVYVADVLNHRIQKFTSTGTFLAKWGSFGTGDGQFDRPNDLAVDSSGNVFVADTNNHRIQKFTSMGAFLTKWGSFGTGDGQLQYPNGVGVDPFGDVYVGDYVNARVQKFSSTGTFLTKWGSSGTGDGQFTAPLGIAFDSSGNVYVVDEDNDRIQKFTSTGTFLTKWGSSGTGDGQLDEPRRVALDSSDNVYVTDAANNRVQKFTSAGAFLTTWGSFGTGAGQFDFPYGVDVGPSGNIYVTDHRNYRVQAFAPRPLLDPPHVTLIGPSPGSLYAVGTPVQFSGAFTDNNIDETHTAVWTFTSGTNQIELPGTVTESVGSGTVDDTFAFDAAGVYRVALTVTDSSGLAGTATTVEDLPAFVVVYDPSGGFVTGGGWFTSPPGTYVPSPTLTGKAAFGFVSKYAKGASIPTGDTEFRFKVADLSFDSTSYDWLVCGGPKCQFKGQGSINGAGTFGFLLSAIDGQLPGGGGQDKLRMKIWDILTGQVIYDNQMGDDDFADPTTVIGGGNIVIHKG